MPEDVQFNEGKPLKYEPPKPRMVQWVINHSSGYIKDEKQAVYLLLGFVALMVIISLLMFLDGSEAIETLPEDFINKPQMLP